MRQELPQRTADPSAPARRISAVAGLGLLVFAVVALSGAGRIDIVDGQSRYEVARSLVDHGDAVVRDSRVWFQVFPGRDARPYTAYRLPQSLLGVPAIALADWTGADTESRRRFFFTLTGAAAAAALAMIYALWFRARGRSTSSALGWASLGILATPCWFYGTSTFDDVLGAASVTLAVVLAYLGRGSASWWPHVGSGLAIGLAFHCKPPLAAFVLVVLAAGMGSALAPSTRRTIVLGLLLVAMTAHVAYTRYKFPPENAAERERLQSLYVPVFPGNPVAGVTSLAVSPGKGVLWYCPAVLLAIAGCISWRRSAPWLVASLAVAGALFVCAIASLTFFSGDPAWGPRYLTPLIALLWLAAPDGASKLGAATTITLLAASVSVQLLSLTVDPHRLYVERSLHSAFYYRRPWVYFDPAVSHLVQRPREILAILDGMRRGENASAFTPAPEPTFTFPVLDYMDRGPAAVERYQVLAGFRPFWLSQRWLPPEQRPVSLAAAVGWLLGCAALGAALVWLGVRSATSRRRYG